MKLKFEIIRSTLAKHSIFQEESVASAKRRQELRLGILFYVTSVRIRVFMRTLESNLVLQLFAVLVITIDISRLVPAILILSILCSSNGFQQTHAHFKCTRLCQQGANAVRRRRRIRRRLCSAAWLQAHAQFNFYISFLCSAIHNSALLSTVTKKRVYAPEAHKIQLQFILVFFKSTRRKIVEVILLNSVD